MRTAVATGAAGAILCVARGSCEAGEVRGQGG